MCSFIGIWPAPASGLDLLRRKLNMRLKLSDSAKKIVSQGQKQRKEIVGGQGRRIVYRLLAWNPWQGVFLRAVAALRRPLRC
jgi:hypothetical protein